MVRRLAAATALLVLLLVPAARADTLRAIVERPLLVVGGHDAPAGSWPSMAAIVLSTQPDAGRGHFCGGTVIAPTAVLTAAHCVRDDADAVRPPAFFDVVVGRQSLRGSDGQRVHVASVAVHPANDPATVRFDAAILLLAEPVSAPPMRLAAAADDTALGTPGSLALVAGWGATDGAVRTFPDALQEAAVPLQADAYCQAGLPGLPYDPASMACAAYDQDDADVCNGDSGGPLARQDAAGAWVQLGIVSWGLEGGCDAPHTPTAYAQVSAISDWALGIVGQPAAAPSTPPVTPIAPPPLGATPPPAATTTPAPVANRPPAAGPSAASSGAGRWCACVPRDRRHAPHARDRPGVGAKWQAPGAHPHPPGAQPGGARLRDQVARAAVAAAGSGALLRRRLRRAGRTRPGVHRPAGPLSAATRGRAPPRAAAA